MMRWRGLLNTGFGLWLISSPFTFGYKSYQLICSDVISGALAIVCGFLTFRYPLFAWGTALIGLWLQLAPLIFWAPEAASYINDTFIGILFLIFSLIIPNPPGIQESFGAEIPRGWSYNPSSYLQRLPIIYLSFFCWLISRYLAAYQLGFIDSVWDPFFEKETLAVLNSKISKDFPVSDAGLGATAYLLEALFGFGDTRRWHTVPWFVMIFGILSIPASCVSIILIILQPTVVGAWCGLCLVTAVLMLFIIPLSIDEVVATIQALKEAKQKGLPLHKTFWLGVPMAPGPEDHRIPSDKASYLAMVKAMVYGISIPWNLAITALIGVVAMFMGDYIPGALITVISITSWAEVMRVTRFAIIPLSLWLLFLNPLLGGITLICSFRKGLIKEQYGSLLIR